MSVEPLRTKRIYDPLSDDDGQRILVDHIWPRGVKREAAKLTEWVKPIAPSSELRKWFGHDPARFAEFRRRYFEELDANEEAVRRLRGLLEEGPTTLLYAARDTAHNNAVVLADYLRTRQSRPAVPQNPSASQ